MQPADFIETSNSPYLDLMVVVPKLKGGLRVCIDFCQVNLDIFNSVYPIYWIKNQLQAMVRAKISFPWT